MSGLARERIGWTSRHDRGTRLSASSKGRPIFAICGAYPAEGGVARSGGPSLPSDSLADDRERVCDCSTWSSKRLWHFALSTRRGEAPSAPPVDGSRAIKVVLSALTYPEVRALEQCLSRSPAAHTAGRRTRTARCLDRRQEISQRPTARCKLCPRSFVGQCASRHTRDGDTAIRT